MGGFDPTGKENDLSDQVPAIPSQIPSLQLSTLALADRPPMQFARYDSAAQG
jgi:hypothetical protein